MELNKVSLDTISATLSYAMGINKPECAADKNEILADYIAKELGENKADRVFMYNPDAVAEWIFRKYPHLMKEAIDLTDVEIPLVSVMPSVTPVCFGTMYTGAQPSVHGIQKYEKPVIRIDTIFDALIRAGKKPVIIADNRCSIGKIFLERDMPYFLYDGYDEVNAKVAELILKDEYDFYVVYNGNYDAVMHKTGPESVDALSELRSNSRAFGTFVRLIENNWRNHNTLIGFAMDHGCHEIDESCGSHGLDMPEDLNITHLYKIIKRG